jgi:hypothetical protein
MAKQNINIGVNPNDGTGDVVREAFRKSKENFDELYARPTGDMNKSTYDANNSGAVDLADKITGVDAAGNVTYYGKDAAGNIGFHTFSPDKVDSYADFDSFPVAGFDDVIYIDRSQFVLYLWDDVGEVYNAVAGGVSQGYVDEQLALKQDKGSTAPTEITSFLPNWQSGLTYTPYATFKNDGENFTDSRSISLTAADPTLDRFDLFAINLTTNQIEVIEGTPANPAVEPSYDPLTHLAANFVSIKAAATTPENVVGTPIWTEGSEWVASASASFDFANTEDPNSGTYAIKTIAPLTVNEALQFAAPSPTDIVEGMELQYKIKNITGGQHRFLITGTKNNNKTGNVWVDAPSNFSITNTTTYQSLTVLIPTGTLKNITYISLVVSDAGTEYFLDDVRLVTGGGNVATGADPNKANVRLDNVAADLSTAELDAFDVKIFKNIAENEYGTHPAFTSQADLNAYLLGNIGAPNTPPTITGIPDQEQTVGYSSFTIDLSQYANDVDGDTLTYTPTSDNESLVTVSVSGSILTVTEVTGTGVANITIQVSDGTATDTDIFTLTVIDPNSAPTLQANNPSTTAFDYKVN